MEIYQNVRKYCALGVLLLPIGLSGCVSQHDFTGVSVAERSQQIGQSRELSTLEGRLPLNVVPYYEKRRAHRDIGVHRRHAGSGGEKDWKPVLLQSGA